MDGKATEPHGSNDVLSNLDSTGQGQQRPFFILTIDGGGFRGAFAAHVLSRMEQAWNLHWPDCFGMFAGTSTGSILAAGLAIGMRADTLDNFYATHGPTIFTPRLASRLDPKKLLASRYDSRALRSILEQEFGNTTLGQIPVPLILPAVDIGNGCVHAFKSSYSDFVRDTNVRLSDAVLASCSAPTYFDPQIVDGKYHLADGGLWANNPALVAVIDAHHRLKIPLADIRVLSIGTGKSKAFYPSGSGKRGWGLMTGWGGGKLLDLILNLQSDAAHNMVCLLLGESPMEPRNVCRLTFESDRQLPMDAVGKLPDWITRAENVFTQNAGRISAFLAPTGVTR